MNSDTGNLADVLWWIKGYNAACLITGEASPFCADHLETIRKARIIMDDVEERRGNMVTAELEMIDAEFDEVEENKNE